MQFHFVINAKYICAINVKSFIQNQQKVIINIKIDKGKDISEIFTGLCKENNHLYELKYFCKTHNILCCAECITKIKGKDHGQHTDCNICSIYDIENRKKSKLEENIKTLAELFINLKESINGLKNIVQKMEKDKEEMRNHLNEREDKLLAKIDEKFNEEYFEENLIKQNDIELQKLKYHQKMEICLVEIIKILI